MKKIITLGFFLLMLSFSFASITFEKESTFSTASREVGTVVYSTWYMPFTDDNFLIVSRYSGPTDMDITSHRINDGDNIAHIIALADNQQSTMVKYDTNVFLYGTSGGESPKTFDSTYNLTTLSNSFGATRWKQGSVVYNNKIYVIGGSDGASALKETWTSTDGNNFTLETSNWSGMSARVYPCVEVYDGYIYVFGGGLEHAETTWDNNVYRSTDGITWSYVATLTEMGEDHFCGEVAGKLYAMNPNLSKIWYSSNGTSFTSDTMAGSFYDSSPASNQGRMTRIFDINNTIYYFGFAGANVGIARSTTPQLILINSITEPAEPVNAFDDFDINVTVADDNGTTITDATVQISFDGGSFQTITYNAGEAKYIFNSTGISSGDHNVAIVSTKTNYGPDYDEFTLQVRTDLTDRIIVTDLDNVTHAIEGVYVSVDPINEVNEIRFSVENIDANSLIIDFNLFNSLRDGRQYFIYTSSSDSDYALNDSLTYGGSLPIQKIWNPELEAYDYDFTDTLISGQTKYYLIKYQKPAETWELMDPDNWYMQMQPSLVLDGNLNINVDSFMASTSNNIRNYYKIPLAQIQESDFKNYEFQFTAWVESGGLSSNFKIGTITNGNIASITQVEEVALTNTPRRYSVSVFSAAPETQIIIYTSIDSGPAKEIKIMDYALIQRGYFMEELEILSATKGPLPVFVDASGASQYVREGKNFWIDSKAYSRDGDVNFFSIEVFIDSADENGLVARFDYAIDPDKEQIISLSRMVNGIVDLNGTGIKILYARIKIRDSANNTVSIQEEYVKIIQFPYFPNDFSIFATETKQKVGEKPKGTILVKTIAFENFLGVRIKIWDDQNTFDIPIVNKEYFSDKFSCQFGECKLDYEIEDWAFTDTNTVYHFAFIGLVNTEYEALAQDNNRLIYYKDVYVVSKQFETQRIFQTRERSANPSKYKNTEKIGLVLQIRDEEYRNLQNDIAVHMKLRNCDAQTDGNCTSVSKSYYPDSFVFDDRTGYNYWFFNQYFTLDDGSLLPDGNYIEFYSIIELLNFDYGDTSQLPSLTRKCKTYDSDNFFSNALASLNHFLFGCTDAQEEVVTATTNPAQIDRILIDNSYAPTAATQEAFLCLNADQNNTFKNEFKQRLFCAVWGTIGEQAIDKLKLTITNNNSDISDKEFQQYIELEIPAEIVLLQDPILLKKFLELNRNTTITTLGDAFVESFNSLATGFGNLTIEQLDEDTISNFTTNVGFDTNFNKAFSPTNVGFIFFYQIDGLRVLNMQDYVEPATVDPKRFIRYARENNIPLPRKSDTTITVYTSDLDKIFQTNQNGYLVINEERTENEIKTVTDDGTTIYESAPKILKFNMISDVFYNNQLNVERRYVPIQLKVIISRGFNANRIIDDIIEWGQLLMADPIGVFIDTLFSYIVVITIILLLLMSIVTIYHRYKQATG